jgi:hypothetical protein
VRGSEGHLENTGERIAVPSAACSPVYMMIYSVQACTNCSRITEISIIILQQCCNMADRMGANYKHDRRVQCVT